MKSTNFNVLLSMIFVSVFLFGGNRTFAEKKIRWELNNNGSFTVRVGDLGIKNCYPAMNGQSITPEKITVTKSRVGGNLLYELGQGVRLEMTLTEDSNSLVLKSKFTGLEKAPDYFCPMAQGLIVNADRFYKQGMGFAGPSGVFPIPSSPQRIDKPGLFEEAFTYDSYLESGIMDSTNTTIVFGAYDPKDYLQRTTIYNRQNRFGLVDRWEAMNQNYYESGFSTEGIPVSKTEFVLPDLHFITGTKPYETFREFARNIAAFNKVVLKQKPSYHWCSWYESERNFNEDILNDFLTGFRNMKPAIPIQVAQIDDGYFEYYGDWLKFDRKKFPSGFEKDIKKITGTGLRAGIWVGPFMVHEKSDLYKQHPDWILHNLDGSPVVEWSRPDGNVFPLDASHPEAFGYLRSVFRGYKKMGITFYKTDFMDWGLKNSLKFKRNTPGKTSVQYYRAVLEMIRQEIGPESYWLACIAPFPPLVGLVDAARFSNDVGPDWNPGSHGNMLQEGFSTQYLNTVLWQNDPDVCYFNSFSTKLSEGETETLAYFDGISGGAVNTSDRFHRMSPKNNKLWRFIQPAPEFNTATIPDWDRPRQLRTLVRSLPENSWAVLVVNTGESMQEQTFKLKDLIGVDKAYVFDWEPGKSSPLGEMSILKQKIDKHLCHLYYISTENIAPARNLGLNGIKVEGLE